MLLVDQKVSVKIALKRKFCHFYFLENIIKALKIKAQEKINEIVLKKI